ncbi:YjgN family protein [Undibacterium sp. Ji22W]|uniref:YjgN family protein n=1 Tax=Undibacterium sp. Ji22W TaxID=3413038 RepID=UPI003BF14457
MPVDQFDQSSNAPDPETQVERQSQLLLTPQEQTIPPELDQQATRVYQPQFTGSGKEYFKIWIVNLCLTLMTFGIYSAWAKVRRLQYFDRNTEFAGSVFNFHGDPKVILRGRIVAAILLFLYHYVFGLSKNFAIVFACLLFLAIPWMLRSALRFRLRNTSYRGLRFDFDGKLSVAYGTYLPVAMVFILPALVAVIFPLSWYVALPSLLYLLWPWLHARMKRYQHGNVAYGQLHARSELSGSAFVWPYFLTGLYIFAVMIVAGIIAAIGAGVMSTSNNSSASYAFMLPILISALIGLTVYCILGPFLQTKIWNRSWNNTQLNGLRFNASMSAWSYTRLQTINTILTILSLGLYRPFAVVRSYEYRLQHMEITAQDTDFDTQKSHCDNENGAAESSAEFLGFDLSW